MNTNKILHKVGVGTCAGLLALTLAACGGNAGSQRGAGAQKPAQEAPANDLESSIAQIQADFEETAQTLLDEHTLCLLNLCLLYACLILCGIWRQSLRNLYPS